jgi:hypothetical protein
VRGTIVRSRGERLRLVVGVRGAERAFPSAQLGCPDEARCAVPCPATEAAPYNVDDGWSNFAFRCASP